MGKFKRYDGYVGCIPQKFIDSHLPICPFCGSNNPHWLLDSRMEMTLAGSRTYYQCECCQGIMSSTAADAGAEGGKNFRINPAMAALNAAQKGTKHQEVGVAYMRVDELGTVCTHREWLGQEFPITYFQNLIGGQAGAQPVEQPAAPQYAQPAAPQYAQPVAPQYAQPVAPQYAQPAAPQYAPPAAPQYAPPAAPQYAPPAAPQYAQPVAPAAVQTGNKFPLASVILIGIAALFSLISDLITQGAYVGGDSIYALTSLVQLLLSGAGYVLMVLGIILMHKKEKNLFLSLSFFALLLSSLASPIILNLQYGLPLDFTLGKFTPFFWVSFLIIAISYLLGRGGKIVNLIGLGAYATVVLINLATYTYGANWLSFFFVTAPMILGLLLHTLSKFKKD